MAGKTARTAPQTPRKSSGNADSSNLIERRPVALLIPYARNARLHDDAHVAQIAASIKEWGWTMPVLVDEENGILAGHGRVLAARKLELAEVPVIVARDWSEEKKRAYILADNKLALNARWDTALLAEELGDLRSVFAIDIVGFSEAELADIFGEAAAPEDFQQYDDGILVEHTCPKCGYNW